MDTKSLPRRHFTKGERKLVGFRLPSELKENLDSLADALGWNITDLVQTALDAYVFDELSKIELKKSEDKKITARGNNNENSKKRS